MASGCTPRSDVLNKNNDNNNDDDNNNNTSDPELQPSRPRRGERRHSEERCPPHCWGPLGGQRAGTRTRRGKRTHRPGTARRPGNPGRAFIRSDFDQRSNFDQRYRSDPRSEFDQRMSRIVGITFPLLLLLLLFDQLLKGA